jgi:hypothetical protein
MYIKIQAAYHFSSAIFHCIHFQEAERQSEAVRVALIIIVITEKILFAINKLLLETLASLHFPIVSLIKDMFVHVARLQRQDFRNRVGSDGEY